MNSDGGRRHVLTYLLITLASRHVGSCCDGAPLYLLRLLARHLLLSRHLRRLLWYLLASLLGTGMRTDG